MSSEFNHLKINLEDIKSATNNFDANKLIGRGGFGSVYKGELCLPQGLTMIAFKRLDPKFGQGNDEFWKEIIMLSKYKHENLVSLLCFCDEGEERILGYEFASRGSLDRYLSDSSLTWTQRIKICTGVACALNYLHKERVIHRDIKSSNILLDENWSAKVSDFGLSKLGLANQPQTHVYSKVVGTPGYCDPLYWEMGFLTKESDVYSFGVVLFEVLCGTSCCKYSDNKGVDILVHMWKHRYNENRLDDIVCSNLKRQIEPESLMTFSAIANRCLNWNRRERPTMLEIIKELEVSLGKQNFPHTNRDLVKLGRLAEPPLSYESEEELLLLLSKGFLYKDITWLSVNKKGVVCEMISAMKCITSLGKGDFRITHTIDSRFDALLLVSDHFQIKVSTDFLVPHVTYTINLIFKLVRHGSRDKWDYGICVPFKYRSHEEAHFSRPFVTELREDGWSITELYQFTCHQSQQQFSIECLRLVACGYLMLEGIEFRPVEYEKEEKNEVNIQSISDTDVYWEQKLSMDYMDFIKLSKETLQWTTKKELYFLLRKGFFVDNGEKWFSINKNMKKCLMIPARAFLKEDSWSWRSLQGSRFETVAECWDYNGFTVKCEIHSQLLSPETTYACHLIYKLPKNYSLLQGVEVISIYNFRNPSNSRPPYYIYLTPHHSTVIGPKVDEKSGIPSYTRKIRGHPKMKKDGWMELQLLGVSTSDTGTIEMHLEFRSQEGDKKFLSGLIVQGIEFRLL